MKRFILFLLLSLICFVQCCQNNATESGQENFVAEASTDSSDANHAENFSEDGIDPIQQKDSSSKKDFDEFFRRFNSDGSFQAKHTRYPFVLIAGGNAKSYDEGEWRLVTFPQDIYTVKHEYVSDSVVAMFVEYPGTKNNYLLFFRYIDNDWYFTDFYDNTASIHANEDFSHDFDEFFQKFNSDESFQSEHIQYPFVYFAPQQSELYSGSKHEIKAYNTGEKTTFIYTSDQYLARQWYVSKNMVAMWIVHRECGIGNLLVFRYYDGDWHNTEIIDHSM